MNVRVVEQGFPLGSDDNEINDLIESLRPATNGILAKLNMEQLLHAHLNLRSMACISSTSSHD